MKLLIVAFVLSLFVWIAPRNGFVDVMGIVAYWITVIGVIIMIAKRAPEPVGDTSTEAAKRTGNDAFKTNLQDT